MINNNKNNNNNNNLQNPNKYLQNSSIFSSFFYYYLLSFTVFTCKHLLQASQILIALQFCANRHSKCPII